MNKSRLLLDIMRLLFSSFPRLTRATAVAVSGVLLCACSSTGLPTPLEKSKLELAIAASDHLNLDDKGRASPLMVRIYELKTDVAFQEADFFTLQQQDKLILGTDLLAKDEIILRPGETRVIRRKSHPDTTAIGVLAGYRQLSSATWRVVYKLKPAPEAAWYRAVIPANKVKLDIALQANDIRIAERD